MAEKDWLFERKQLLKNHKRTQFVVTLLVLVMVVFLFKDIGVGSTRESRKPSFVSSDYIARIDIEGMLVTDQKKLEKLRDIVTNNSIKAVVLRLNSPGGTVAGSEQYYNVVREIATNKPIVAVIEDMATSGGYMVAVASNYIAAGNMSITGSIGVLLQFSEVTELAKKLGIELESIKSSPLKAAPNPFEKMDEKTREVLQGIIEDIYQSFVVLVKQGRNFNDEQVKKLADGRIFTGKQAVDVGLIDVIGGEKEVLQWLQQEKQISDTLEVREYSLEDKYSKISNFFAMVYGMFSTIAYSAQTNVLLQ